MDLGELETTEESCGLLEEKLDLESIQGELEKDSLLEEICWRQNLEFFVLEKKMGILNFFFVWPILTRDLTS